VRDLGDEQRELFRRWPSGVSVVAAESGGRKAGLTVNSLVSLSLVPPLVGISLAVVASLYEVLREAGEWSVSILGADQDHVAQHFARNVPPLVQWERIPVREGDALLLEGALGWLRVRTAQEVPAGDHTLFIGEVLDVEAGVATRPLVYLDRRYLPL
jgi:flavin reductase (DIM6/NTAB) family NADH-FMN oxidoreductase RutF